MDDAYEIGIRLVLENGVSSGIAALKDDLAAYDRALTATTVRLRTLSLLGGVGGGRYSERRRRRALMAKVTSTPPAMPMPSARATQAQSLPATRRRSRHMAAIPPRAWYSSRRDCGLAEVAVLVVTWSPDRSRRCATTPTCRSGGTAARSGGELKTGALGIAKLYQRGAVSPRPGSGGKESVPSTKQHGVRSREHCGAARCPANNRGWARGTTGWDYRLRSRGALPRHLRWSYYPSAGVVLCDSTDRRHSCSQPSRLGR